MNLHDLRAPNTHWVIAKMFGANGHGLMGDFTHLFLLEEGTPPKIEPPRWNPRGEPNAWYWEPFSDHRHSQEANRHRRPLCGATTAAARPRLNFDYAVLTCPTCGDLARSRHITAHSTISRQRDPNGQYARLMRAIVAHLDNLGVNTTWHRRVLRNQGIAI